MMNLKQIFMRKNGFGIAEVLVSAAVLGFMVVALNKLQNGNHDSFLRIRGRDGAVEVAQQVLDSLKALGVSSVPSKSNPEQDTSFSLGTVSRQWERGLGGHATVVYSPTVTVSPTKSYTAENVTSYETVKHIFAKQVNVKVEWNFKGSTQSIDVSGVVR